MTIIFKAEAGVDGLPEKILDSLSISYATQLEPWTPSERESLQKQALASAMAESTSVRGLTKGSLYDSDLFFTKSILVSTNWNKNDDVFSPVEVWASRHTPSHKPTNIEHDEHRLVGHITETWALDSDGNLIPDNAMADELPEFYHIANGAVIYTNWQDDKLVEQTQKLIADIQAGKKFVSMEAIFTNFDYAVVTPENSSHVVARTQDTAFLTKHLRCYGGTGEFEGCKLGRILKNITFSGKGYVDRPANPHSIIFQDGNLFNHTAASSENPFSKESGVSFSCSSISSKNESEKSLMSDTQLDLLKSQNDEFKQTIAGLQAKVEEMTKASSEAGIKKLESQIEALSAKLEAAEKERDEAKAEIKTLSSEKDEISEQLTKANEAKETLEKEVSEAKEAQVKANRISHLVDGGVNKDIAEAKVEVFANLNDEQFNVVAEDIISAAKKHMEDEDKKKKEDDKSDASDDSSDDDVSKDDAAANVDDNVLDNAEADEQPDLTADASDSTEPTEYEQQVNDLRVAIASRFGFVDEDADSNE